MASTCHRIGGHLDMVTAHPRGCGSHMPDPRADPCVLGSWSLPCSAQAGLEEGRHQLESGLVEETMGQSERV